MSRRIWLPCALSLGIVLAGQAQAQTTHHRNTHHRATRPPAIEAGSPLQSDIARIAGALEAANARMQAAQQKEDAADRSRKDMAAFADRMVTAASIGAGMIFVGVVLVAFTLAAARRAVRAGEENVREMRRVGEAQTRAYLHAGEGKFKLGEDSFGASMFLRNTGRSPATNVGIAGTLSIYNSDQLLASIDFESKNAPPIAAETEGLALFDIPKLPEFGGADLVRNLRIRIRCEVSWDDVFGRPQNLPLSLLMSDLGELKRGQDAKPYRDGRLIAVNRNAGNGAGAA